MSDVEMGRVTIQMPVETLTQMREWARAAGLKPGQFNSVALAMGARQLAINIVPERVYTEETMKAIADVIQESEAKIKVLKS